MPHWPIRVKLIAGLSLVVGMMLTLMGGSIFGLHAFHPSNLTLTDQLPELGASKDLLKPSSGSMPLRDDAGRGREALQRQVGRAREALSQYFKELEAQHLRGNRADDGRDEFGLAFLIDHDLTAILTSLTPERAVAPPCPARRIFLEPHPELTGDDALGRGPEVLAGRIDRLNQPGHELPDKLHGDLYAVLQTPRASTAPAGSSSGPPPWPCWRCSAA